MKSDERKEITDLRDLSKSVEELRQDIDELTETYEKNTLTLRQNTETLQTSMRNKMMTFVIVMVAIAVAAGVGLMSNRQVLNHVEEISDVGAEQNCLRIAQLQRDIVAVLDIELHLVDCPGDESE